MSESKRSLSKISLFCLLDEAALRVLDAQCVWRRAEAGAWVLDYRDENTDVFFILRGRLRVSVLSSDREVILRDLADGDFFGELAAIDGRPRSAGIVAITDAEIGRMSAARFREAIHHHPHVCDGVMLRLAGEIRKLAERVNEFSTMNVGSRLRSELLRLSRPGAEDGTAIVTPPPTHLELAARISTHREAVTRELKSLERAGLIERRRNGIVLLRPKELLKDVEDDV
jgi:CRP/FNR family transcriptional regulator, cyclic AMP receptor protein